MAKDPAFLFYSSDFLTGTMFFSNEQAGIYIKLLCAQHQCGGLIEKSIFNTIVGSHECIRNKFIETPDGFFNQRLMDEMVKRSNKSTNLSINAKKRWEKQSCKSNAKASNLHMPIENENEDENKDEIKDLFNQKEAFEKAWYKYPIKDGKKAAERVFRASVTSQIDMDSLMQAMANYLKSEKVQKGFIKNGSTWFNNWQDWKNGAMDKKEVRKDPDPNCKHCQGDKRGIFAPGSSKFFPCSCTEVK